MRERKQLEEQRERELKMKEEEEKTSVGRQMREKRSKKHEILKGFGTTGPIHSDSMSRAVAILSSSNRPESVR